MKSENNCFTCKHRGTVPGSVHSCCEHPIVKKGVLRDYMMLKLTMGLGNTNPTGLVVTNNDTGETIPMQAWDEHGISKGWVLYPFNFDPTWLKHCLLHETKREDQAVIEE